MNDQEAYLIASRREEHTLIQVFRRYVDLRLLPDHPVFVDTKKRGDNERGMLVGGEGNYPSIGRAALQAEAEVRWADIRSRRAATLRGLTGLMHALGQRRERKAVVLVSEGFVIDPAMPEHRELIEAARLAHTAIHFLDVRDANPAFSHEADTANVVDVRDLSETFARASRTADGSKALALATGGRVLHDSASLDDTLGRIAAGLRSYYLVGYAPQQPADGRYHKLHVEVRRPGLRVEARPGYYALSPAQRQAPSGEVPDALRAALDSPFDAADLPVQLAGYVLGSQGKRARVRLVAEVDATWLRSPEATASVVDGVFQLVARGRDEAQYRALEAPIAHAVGRPLRLESDFEVRPGAYQAQVVLRERGTGRSGSARQALEVLPEQAFRISTPVLTDIVVGNPPNVSPVARADRRFRRSKDLYCYVEVSGASPGAPVLAGVDVRDRGGRLRASVPASALSTRHLSRLWALPLAGLEPGPYELVVSVRDTGTRQGLERREAFEVLARD
jgi:hypothetical protein